MLAGMGVGIALAFSGTLGSFSAGVMLLVFRPFKIGDYVSVAGETGTVDEVGIFTTTLNTPDNRRIILPNSNVFGSTIENMSKQGRWHYFRLAGDEAPAEIRQALDWVTGALRTDPVIREDARRLPGVLRQDLRETASCCYRG